MLYKVGGQDLCHVAKHVQALFLETENLGHLGKDHWINFALAKYWCSKCQHSDPEPELLINYVVICVARFKVLTNNNKFDVI